VREALARLESEGMIVVEGRGFVVPELTDADIEEIYQLRFLLEPAAASIAVAEVGSPTDLASMSLAVDDSVAAEKTGDFPRLPRSQQPLPQRLARPGAQPPHVQAARPVRRPRPLPACADAGRRRRARRR
jgi:DNA-binding GntR family transcriptional regulator